MNRQIVTLLAALAALAAPLSASPRAEPEQGLVIYAYDSFVSEWGPAGKVIPGFEAQTGVEGDGDLGRGRRPGPAPAPSWKRPTRGPT